MENFSKEIVQALIDDYGDDTKLVVGMLSYLYSTTIDDKMKETIIDIFNDTNICIECGSEMTPYEWVNADGETVVTFDCLSCSHEEVE